MSEFLPPNEVERSKSKLINLLHLYMAGDSHEHTVFSNPTTRHEADYTFEQVFRYIQSEINSGENKMEFVVLAEHASDAANPKLVNGQALLEHQEKVHDFMEKQKNEVAEYPELISGVETSIISAVGDLDVSDNVLSQIDLVIASKHDLKSVFPEQNGQPTAEQLTNIYLKLMQNPNVDVIGHPNRYVSYEDLNKMDWQTLFNTAKETHTALEINFNAPMPEELIKQAVAAGVPLFLGTDAHNLKDFQRLGEDIRQKIEKEDNRLDYPLGVKFSFWKKVARVLRTLEEVNAPAEQIITSSKENLADWLSKDKEERTIPWIKNV